MKNIMFLVGYALVCGLPMPLAADPLETLTPEQQAESDGLIREGVEHYGNRRYEEAVDSFKQAFEIKEEPELIYNIARCYERMIQSEEALAWYQRLVERPGTTGELRTKALNNIAALRQEINAKRNAQQTASSNDTNANGASNSQTNADGASSGINGASRYDEEFGAGTRDTNETGKKRKSMQPDDLAGWILTGVGAVGLITGSIFGGLALKKNNDYESAGFDPDRLDYRDDVRQNALVFDVAFSSGAVLAATGVTLLVVNTLKRRSKRETAMARRTFSVQPTFQLNQRILGCGFVGRF